MKHSQHDKQNESIPFDLNIEHYQVHELESLLKLKKPYDFNDIKSCCQHVQTNLTEDNHLGEDKRNNIFLFLENVSNRLLSSLNQGRSKPTNSTARDTNIGVPFEHRKNDIYEQGNNIIIENPTRKEAKYLKAMDGRLIDSNDVPPGLLNPIKFRTIKRAINIDTRFRRNYYNTSSTDIQLTLPTKINKVVSMRLSSLEIPLTYYAISSNLGNNTFVFEDISNNVQHVCYLPDGNYEPRFSDQTKAISIEEAMNNALASGGVDTTKVAFTVDRTSGRSVFATVSGATSPITSYRVLFGVNDKGEEDINTALQFRLGWQLGFRSGTYEASDPSGGAITSEGICFVRGPRYMYLAIDDFNNSGNNYFESAFSDSILSPNILARINVSSIQADRGVYQSGEDDGFNTQINRKRTYFGPVDIQNLHIQLLDEYGRVLDLNNMDWSFALSFEIMYN
jgi:hypothetical protein